MPHQWWLQQILHSVLTLRTVTMSKEQEEFRRKVAVTFEAFLWC